MDKLEFDAVCYAPLGERELSELMSRIEDKFPLETDFGSPEPAKRRTPNMLTLGWRKSTPQQPTKRSPRIAKNIRCGLSSARRS